jgi:hypothetical protein
MVKIGLIEWWWLHQFIEATSPSFTAATTTLRWIAAWFANRLGSKMCSPPGLATRLAGFSVSEPGSSSV